MDDPIEIGESGGIKPIIGGSSSWYQYSPTPRQKKQPVKFKKGEIIQGTIQKVISPEQALIVLPSGTFTCYLKGQLKSGDSLFFIVNEIEPVLHLKIYAISALSGKDKITINEAIRILNFPDSNFYKEALFLFIQLKNIIIRDDVLEIHRACLKLNEEQVKDKTLQGIIKTMFFMKEAGFPLETELFIRSYPLYIDISEFEQAFKTIISNIKSLPLELSLKFSRVFRLMSNYEKNRSYILRLVRNALIGNMKSDIFIKLLNEIADYYERAKDKNPKPILSAANFILSIIESQFYWNKLAYKYDGFMHFFIPVFIENNIGLMRLLTFKLNDKKKNYEIPGAEPLTNAKVPDGMLLSQNLNLEQFGDRKGMQVFFEGYLDNLQRAMTSGGFAIISASMGRDNYSIPSKGFSGTIGGYKNLSFVI